MSSAEIQYQDSVAISILVVSSLSFCGSAFVVIAYICLKQLRSFALKMVVYLCLADILGSISTYLIMPYRLTGKDPTPLPNISVCHVQAYLRILADLSSILWSILISVGLYLTIVKNDRQLAEKECIFLIIAYLVPMIVALGPLFLQDVGINTYYCWLQDELTVHNYLYEVLFLYGPLWCAVLVITFINVRILQVLKRLNVSNQDMQSFARFTRYPLVLVACGIFSTVSFISELSGKTPNALWLQLLSYTLSRAQGLFNAMIYGFTPGIRQKIAQMCCSDSTEKSPILNNSSRSSNTGLKEDLRDVFMDEDEAYESQNQQQV